MSAGDGKVIHLPEEHDLHLSALYHQTDAPQPSPALEQRILSAAREAAENQARARQAQGRRRVPLPLAALLLVASGLLPLLFWHGYQGGFSPARSPAPAAVEQVQVPMEPPPALLEEEAGEPLPEALELQAIQDLIAAGEDAEAWARFNAFRGNFPGHRIPDDVLDQLADVRMRLLEDGGMP